MKVLLAAMLVDALHAALEDREVAFNRVGVHSTDNVLLASMANHAVIGIMAFGL
jgi:hypothetical protein